MKMKTNIRAGTPLLASQIASTGTAAPVASFPTFVVADVEASHTTPRVSVAPNPLAGILEWIRTRLPNVGEWYKARQRLPTLEAARGVRFWEMDAIRGLALAMMLLKHFIDTWLVLLSASGAGLLLTLWLPLKQAFIFAIASGLMVGGVLLSPLFETGTPASPWRVFGLAAALALSFAVAGWMATYSSGATSFIFIMGTSMAISSARERARAGGTLSFGKYLHRGLQLLVCGMALTALSLLMVPSSPIWFGILHLLGVSTVLAFPFLLLPAWMSVAAGLGVLALKDIVPNLAVAQPWGFLLGIYPAGLATLDYQPLIPLFGLVLLGLAAGKILYPQGQMRRFELPDLSGTRPVRALNALGRNSLGVYLAQAPLVLAGASALAGA